MKKIILRYKGWFALTFFMKIMVGVVFISISLALQRIVDAAVTGDVKKLINTFIWVVGYFVVVGLTDYLHRIIEAYYITKTLCHFKKKIFEGLLRQDYVSFISKIQQPIFQV
ncbi:hypothetical protein [Cellulosilyticum ruminicola]|uniref:hypothetical protein n=1 Tax=Cellulosilyticum ruminicola TaxID=425254 RepID=UPI0006D22189|nr:hypothetical protein [Cellulosilyticum ruminicola]